MYILSHCKRNFPENSPTWRLDPGRARYRAPDNAKNGSPILGRFYGKIDQTASTSLSWFVWSLNKNTSVQQFNIIKLTNFLLETAEPILSEQSVVGGGQIGEIWQRRICWFCGDWERILAAQRLLGRRSLFHFCHLSQFCHLSHIVSLFVSFLSFIPMDFFNNHP